MLLTLLRRFAFILTVFPGIIYVILKMLSSLRIHKSSHTYLLSLLIGSIFSMVMFNQWATMLKIFFIVGVALSYIFVESLGIKFNYFVNHAKINLDLLTTIILFPILEEFNFRQLLWVEMTYFNYNYILYIVLSAMAFLVTHIVYQGISAFIKIPFAVGQAIIFLSTQNILIVIIIHLIFNTIVLIDRIENQKLFYR
ncbi:MAG: CPBP family intramembrane metalloprotease [Lactobacillus sp.]|uniref:CPBP family glutamic-type intramembrane protease n=1 Tax=Bombilactobacillus bombi TaxID=1303590 RepID=UPI0035E720CE|nr:CPBP family intramembrane metalloprotease [Lactobacillus sp.]